MIFMETEMNKLFYIIQWCVLVLCITPSTKKGMYTKLRQLIGGCIYVFFAMVRDVTFNPRLDAYAYYNIYSLADMPLKKYLVFSNVEPGYSFLTWVFKNIFNSYVMLLLFIYLFIYCCYCYFLNNLPKQKGLLCVSAILGLDLFTAYYLQRNMLAVAMSLIMLIFLYNKKYLKAFLILVCSIMFHYSAIIFFPVFVFSYLRDNSKLKKGSVNVLEMLSLIICFLGTKILSEIFLGNQKYSVYNNSGSLAIGTYLFSAITIVLFLKQKGKFQKELPFLNFLGMSFLGVIFVLPLQMMNSIMYRMLLFFLPLLIIMLNYCVKEYINTRRYYLYNSIFLIYCIYRIYTFFNQELVYIGMPYKWIF